MNGRVARKIRSTVWIGKDNDPRNRRYFSSPNKKARPSCVADDQRRFYQNLKALWQRVPRSLRRIANIKIVGGVLNADH